MATGLVLVQLVLAAPPTADFSITNSTPLIGDAVTFTSTVADPDNDVMEIAWDFDYDGTFDVDMTGEQVTHAYATAGAKTVALRVTDGMVGPGPDPDPVDVVLVTHPLTVVAPNVAPTASFTAPNTAQIGETVNFNGSGSTDSDGTITRYEWDLDGNGSFETDTGSSATSSRANTTPGPVSVKLRVTDSDGAVSAVASKTVTVNNAAPTASFTAAPDPAQISQPITFNARPRMTMGIQAARSHRTSGTSHTTAPSTPMPQAQRPSTPTPPPARRPLPCGSQTTPARPTSRQGPSR